MNVIIAGRGAGSLTFPLSGGVRFYHTGGRRKRRLIETLARLFHNSVPQNPEVAKELIHPHFCSAWVLLMYQLWCSHTEAGRLTSRASVSPQALSVHSSMWLWTSAGFVIQILTLFEEKNKRKGDQQEIKKGKANSPRVETFLGISATRPCPFLWGASTLRVLSMLQQY